MDKVSMHTLFLSQHITQNVLLSSYLDSWDIMYFKIFLWSFSEAMADSEKRGEDENTKIKISEERKELCQWNKKHFS